MDRGAWQATVHRVTKSQTWLKQLSIHTFLDKRTSIIIHHGKSKHWKISASILGLKIIISYLTCRIHLLYLILSSLWKVCALQKFLEISFCNIKECSPYIISIKFLKRKIQIYFFHSLASYGSTNFDHIVKLKVFLLKFKPILVYFIITIRGKIMKLKSLHVKFQEYNF